MVGYLRTLAADFDGTLSHDGRRPDERVLSALRVVREGGGLTLLVTGRILSELRIDFPDVEEHFDAIVAENGCIVWNHDQQRALGAPVDRRLVCALAARGISVRAGEVLLAGREADRIAVLEEAHRLELDCQIVFRSGGRRERPRAAGRLRSRRRRSQRG